ncbi:MAG: hypothetical protein ACYCYM_03755 [Saccharofermentanales bacterium]
MKKTKIVSLIISIILVLSMIQISPMIGVAGEDPYVFQDSLANMSNLWDYGLPTIAFYQCNSGSDVGGDHTVMIDNPSFEGLKDAGGQMVVFPYLTWKVNGGAKVEFFAYLWDPAYNFTLSWSADGYHFNDISLDSVQVDAITEANKVEKGLGGEDLGGALDVAHRLYTINQIDATARFFKVTWPKIDGSWKAAPSMVRFSGGIENTIDTSFDKEIVISNNATADTADMVQYTDAFQFDQAIETTTPVIMVRYDYLSGKSSVVKPSMVYEIDSAKAFMASVMVHETYYKTKSEFRFYAAETLDGTWTEVYGSKNRVRHPTNNGFSSLHFAITDIPAGTKYMKIEYPFDKDLSAIPWADGTPGTPGNPLTYMGALYAVKYTEYVAPPISDITADTVSDFQGNMEADTATWYDYSRNIFNYDQKLTGVPFLALDWYAVNGKETLPEIFVTYKVKAGSPFMLTSVRHVRFINLDLNIKLYSSADGTAWEELTDIIFSSEASETALGFNNERFIVEAIPATHKYVKVVYPNTKDYTGTPDPVMGDNIGDPITYGVGLISAKYNASTELPEIATDTTVDFAGNQEADTATWYDYTKNIFDFDQKLAGVPFLALAWNSVNGKTTLPEIFVAYEVKAGSPFILTSVRHVRFIDLGLDIKLYSSANGTDWEEITNATFEASASSTAPGFDNERFVVESIPATHKYVKIVYPNTKDYTGTPDPVAGDTIGDPITYGVGLVSVKFNAPDEVPDEETPDLSDITGDTVIGFTGDEEADSDKMFGFNAAAIDFSQMLQVGDENINVLMLKYEFVLDNDSLPEAYVIYKVAPGSPFKIEGFNHVNALALGLDFILMGSSNGTDWSVLDGFEYIEEDITDVATWKKIGAGIVALPSTVEYVKIVWPNEKDYTGDLNPDDASVLDTLNYAPALMSVTFNAPETTDTDNEENPQTGDAGIIFTIALLLASIAAASVSLKKQSRA